MFLRKVLNAGPSARARADAEQAQRDELIAGKAKIAEYIAMFRCRAKDNVNQLNLAVAKLSAQAGTKSDETHQTAIARLTDLRAEFLKLHDRHVAAIAESKWLAVDEAYGAIYEVKAEIVHVVEATSSRVSAEMGRGLSRRYADIPAPGSDPEYDEVLRERRVLYEETTERVRAMSYPGDPPAGVTPEIARLVFGRACNVAGSGIQ